MALSDEYQDRRMIFGILALALQVIFVIVEAILLGRERAHGWTYAHPIMFEFQNLASAGALLLCASVIVAIIGLVLDTRRKLCVIALLLFPFLILIAGGIHGIS